MAIDVDRARRDTPGCAHVLHFNNAGAALMLRPVLDAVTGHMQFEGRIGGYEAVEQAHDAIEHVYDAAARLLGRHRDEIAFIESATRAWDMAFYSVAFKPGDRILTSMAEYASNYIAYLQVARTAGAVAEAIHTDADGQISVEALQDTIDERVKLISITHVPTNGGLVNPAAAVGRIARKAGIPYLLDACQSVGQMPVSVEEIGCDMLSATGRKHLRGPRATGLLYVRRSLLERLEPLFLDRHAATWVARDRYEIRPDPRRFENWETNCAGKIGLGVAIDYAIDRGLDAVRRRVYALADMLRGRLAELPGVSVHDIGAERCGIVTCSAAAADPATIKARLASERINVTVSTPAGTRLDMEARGLGGLVRASVHYYNTEAEIGRFCRALTRVTGV